MEIVLAIVLLAAVAAIVARPLRRSAEWERREASRREELEASRDAIYRQIGEAELDMRAGKLAEEDWRVADRELRARAIEVLRELDELGEGEPAGGDPAGEGR